MCLQNGLKGLEHPPPSFYEFYNAVKPYIFTAMDLIAEYLGEPTSASRLSSSEWWRGAGKENGWLFQSH